MGEQQFEIIKASGERELFDPKKLQHSFERAGAGLHMVSWDHPEQGSLKRMIELAQLYPITCLNSASSSVKQKLLDENIVICKEILRNEKLLEKATEKPRIKRAIMHEIEDLCGK